MLLEEFQEKGFLTVLFSSSIYLLTCDNYNFDAITKLYKLWSDLLKIDIPRCKQSAATPTVQNPQ